MIENKIKITIKDGIHMRPAMHLTDLSNEYKSDIIIEKNENKVNAKSMWQVTSLAIIEGDEIIIKIDGKDEKEAMKAIKELIENDFEEDPNKETIKTFEATDKGEDLTSCNTITEMFEKLDGNSNEEKKDK